MKDKESRLSHERLLRVLDYDPNTGIFLWKLVTSNRVKIGSRAGVIAVRGYRIISIDGDKHMAHRVAIFYVTGEWPEYEVDHKNGVHDENCIENLRPATIAQNRQNSCIGKNNITGFKGITAFRDGRWRAQIGYNGTTKHLGIFNSKEDAHAAYAAASQEHHGEFGRLR